MSTRERPDRRDPILRFLIPHHDLQVGWTGDWPPPERFLVLRGQGSKMVKVWPEPDTGAKLPEPVIVAAQHPTIEAAWYKRRSYSKFSQEEVEAMNERAGREVLRRGAEYDFDEWAEFL